MLKSFNKNFINNYIVFVICFLSYLFSDEKLRFKANKLETINNDVENIRVFKDNVVVTKGNLSLYSKQATHYPDSFKVHLKGDVRMYDNLDSLFCEEIILFDDTLKKFIALGDVQFFKNNQSIKSEKMKYNTLDTLNNIQIDFVHDIKIQDSLRVVYGDSMSVFYQDSILENIKIKKNAKILNYRYAKIDTISKEQIFDDILKSKKMNIDFVNENLNYIELIGMSETSFNVIQDSLLKGLNQLSGDSILIYLNSNNIDEIYVKGGARGYFKPETNNTNIEYDIKYNADNINYYVKQEFSYFIDNAEVQYGETFLKAGEIYADWEKNYLEARIKDDVYPSVSGISDNPTYGDLLVYDLISKKGKMVKGETEYGQGSNIMYYKGDDIHRNDDLIYHISNSILTSCDHEQPHYFFKSKQMKMIPNENIYAKPMTLYIHDYPLFTIPFAIFPNKMGERISGWIMPSFGNNKKGTYINDLGYYYAPNDFLDNLFLIDIYDRYGIQYLNKVRYKKYSGKSWYQSIEGSLQYEKFFLFDNVEQGNEDIFNLFNEGEYKSEQDIKFHHKQIFDPTQRLTIDYKRHSKNSFHQKISLKEKISQQNETKLNYSKNFENSSISIGYSYNNNLLISDPISSSDKSMYKSFNGPTFNYNYPSRYIFENHNSWYNKILFSFSSNYSSGSKQYTKEACLDLDRDGECEDEINSELYENNNISTECNDSNSDGVCDNCIDDNEDGKCDDNFWWSNNEKIVENYGGLQNTFTISMSSPFELFAVTPSLSLYYDIANKYKTCSTYDENDNLVCDENEILISNKTVDRLSWKSSVTFSSNVYGFLPLNIRGLRVIRHKFSPSVSISYQPRGGYSFINHDLDQYYYQPKLKDGELQYYDSTLILEQEAIDMLDNTSVRRLGNGSKTISINLNNDFQAKIYGQDSPIHLFQYNISSSYNDKRIKQFDDLSTILKIHKPDGSKLFDITFLYEMYDKKNKLYFSRGKFPKLKTVKFGISQNFKFNGLNKVSTNDTDTNQNMLTSVEQDSIFQINNSFIDMENYVPTLSGSKLWEANVKLNFNAFYQSLSASCEKNEIKMEDWDHSKENCLDEEEYEYTPSSHDLEVSELGLSINSTMHLTDNWLLGYTGSINLLNKNLYNQSITLTRDLHCWNFMFLWYPSGYSKGFRLKININNPDLQDVKIRSTSSGYAN